MRSLSPISLNEGIDLGYGLCHISGFYLLLLSSRREPGYAIPMPYLALPRLKTATTCSM